MSTPVRIQIDLRNGSVNVEAPVEAIDTIFDRLDSFLPRLVAAHDDSEEEDADDLGAPESESDTPPVQAGTGTASSASNLASKGGTTRKRGAAKPETFKSVNLGLDDAQRKAFKEFFSAKQPKGQSQEVLVVAAWLTQQANLTSLSKDQVFTALRTVGARVPTRLSSVMSNLVLKGVMVRDDKNFVLHHTGEDFVTHELPKPAETK
ncbi:hypothetical protein J421_3769 [Gemmatirosa kalamazoonensis]|uniref:Uncharacterized protein n=1 Tax=Gemmatirosa kalamazoonensis TaxID=861299 RepID=W0RKM4_9BACT|nr:hypothetical protein [Gemmatirosa kalamazoonensis]AHG91306.1 hypothetical protein J421_3769 [Gemmatirosa kalamazoonensis]